MSTTEVNQPPAADGSGELPETPAAQRESSLPASVWQRWLARLAPTLVYLAIRETGVLMLAWMAGRGGTDVTTALTAWDGQWFTAIAQYGYDGVPSRLVDNFGRHTSATPLAFFPGYPYVVRWVAQLPGVGFDAAAFTVSLASGVACAYGLARLGRRVTGSSRVALIFVALFAASPMAIVLSMAYSEAMFCALAAWALVGVVERRWWLAGVCAIAAGLVRPTAMALVVVVMAAAVVALVRRRDGWRPWLGLVSAPLGLLAYLGYVAYRTGDLTGWFDLQRQGWGS
ncbi:MAG TPA: hypothetical protein VGD84_15395, partial [Pseudonocardiaceae bacterium]